jgi:hypothetical protein
VSIDEKYSFKKFEELLNKIQLKLKYDQTDWSETVELIRKSAEFVIYSEKYAKTEHFELMK